MGTVQACNPLSDTSDAYEKVVSYEKDLPSFRISFGAKLPIGKQSRAAPIRFAAVLGGVGFEDVLIDFKKDWRQKHKRRGVSPHLTIIDKDGNDVITLKETLSQLRYVGGIAGLYNGSRVKRALIDEILDYAADCGEEVAATLKTESKEDDKQVIEERVPFWLKKLENKLQENKERGHANGFFIGDDITIADLQVYGLILFLCQDRIIGGKALVETKKELMAHRDRIESNEKIKAYNQQLHKDCVQFAKDQSAATVSHQRQGKFVPGQL